MRRVSLSLFATGIALIAAAHRLAPSDFRWRTEPYEFVADTPAIDLLTGGGDVRRAVDANTSLGELVATFDAFEREFAERRRPALIPDYL